MLRKCTIYNATTNVILFPNAMIADNDNLRQLGFQYFEEMEDEDSILFLFEDEKVRSMHMRNVKFPLLMTWMDSNHVVCGMSIAEANSPLLYSSTYPAQFCLESHPDLIYKIRIGDVLKFLKTE